MRCRYTRTPHTYSRISCAIALESSSLFRACVSHPRSSSITSSSYTADNQSADRVKTEARKHGRSCENSYNPFQILWTPKRRGCRVDGSSPVSKTKTENDMIPEIEMDRRRSFAPRPPPHPSSMPMDKTEQIRPLSPSKDRLADIEADPEKSRDSSATQSDTITPLQPVNGQTRQRCLNSLRPSRQNSEDNESQSEHASERKRQKQKFTFVGQFKATVLNSYINVLFVFIPIGIAMHFVKVSPVVVFVTNFIAIIPLAAMLSYATEEIALRTGETIGGLLNASFGYVT